MSEYLLLRDSLRKSRNWTVVPKEVVLVEEVLPGEELLKNARIPKEFFEWIFRYLGMEKNLMDFWASLCSNDVHPVGWAARQELTISPPKCIEKTQVGFPSIKLDKEIFN